MFNVLVSNNDDHARNHAAFWDGEQLTLTPAYDICPQARSGGEATQVMAIGRDGWKFSQLAACVERSTVYQLPPGSAQEIVDHQVAAIKENWAAVCDEAGLTPVERGRLWQRQFLNPCAFQ